MTALQVWIDGVGLLGPGLDSWAGAQAVLRGAATPATLPTVLPIPVRLPAAERRRAGAAIKLALAVADEAVALAQVDPATLATVFTSSSGEGSNCHALCEALDVPLLGRIPFDRTLARTFDKGIPLLDNEYPTIQRFQDIAGRIRSLLDYKKVLAEKL